MICATDGQQNFRTRQDIAKVTIDRRRDLMMPMTSAMLVQRRFGVFRRTLLAIAAVFAVI